MLTPSEVLNAITDAELSCLDIDDESVEHDIDVVLDHLRRLYSTDPITPERMRELGATLSEDDDDEWWELDGVDVLNAAGMWMVGEVRVHTVGQLLMSVSVVKMQWELEEDAVE